MRLVAHDAAGTPATTRILIVEDNLVDQRVAAGLLVRRGHDVTVAQNGAYGLVQLERGIFDIVLMDLQMPMMSGIEATAAIRARERIAGGHIRIIAMTAHVMTGDRERCLQAGMDGYLSKPIEPQLLFAAVEQPPARNARGVLTSAGANNLMNARWDRTAAKEPQ